MIRLLIGISTAEQARRASFYSNIDSLQMPQGTMKMIVSGPSIAQNRNIIAKHAIDNGCSHILFVDDDIVVQPDALIKLICENVDIITGIHYHRNYPHRPLIYDYFDRNRKAHIRYLNDNDSGLISIIANGLGFCLMKTKVFSKLEEPWFRLGEINVDELGEDLGFFRRVAKFKLKHFCHLDVPIGHMSNVTIWPQKSEQNGWLTAYDTNGEGLVHTKQMKSPELVGAK